MSRFGEVVIVDGTTGSEASVDADRNLGVRLQDQHTPPIDALFAKSISNFTLSVDSGISTDTVLVYTFTATGGHGIATNDEILLIDTAANWSLQAVVKNVSTNVITIDRPIDHEFASATTLGRITTTNMAVDGSSTPQIFSVRAGTTPLDFTRLMLTIISGTDMDDSKFGGINALTNGVVFRVVNSFQKTVFNFKSNQDIKQFCYDVTYSDKAPAGKHGLVARITFAGQDKHGVTLRIESDDVLQWVIQDNLAGLDSFRASAQGHETDM